MTRENERKQTTLTLTCAAELAHDVLRARRPSRGTCARPYLHATARRDGSGRAPVERAPPRRRTGHIGVFWPERGGYNRQMDGISGSHRALDVRSTSCRRISRSCAPAETLPATHSGGREFVSARSVACPQGAQPARNTPTAGDWKRERGTLDRRVRDRARDGKGFPTHRIDASGAPRARAPRLERSRALRSAYLSRTRQGHALRGQFGAGEPPNQSHAQLHSLVCFALSAARARRRGLPLSCSRSRTRARADARSSVPASPVAWRVYAPRRAARAAVTRAYACVRAPSVISQKSDLLS